MDPIYQEQIPAELAQQILQDDFIPGKNMSYYVITELSNTVVLQHDNITKKDVETTLTCEQAVLEAPIPKIESYSGVYNTPKTSKYVLIQIAAVAVMALVAAVGLYITYINILR